jgi:hypothetical protein
MVVKKRPDAARNIGMDMVAKAPPDGHTTGLGQTADLAIRSGFYASKPSIRCGTSHLSPRWRGGPTGSRWRQSGLFSRIRSMHVNR